MKVFSVIVVLALLAVVAQASRPMRKSLKPALIEKKSHKHAAKILPHPTQHYRAPVKEGKKTPGKACHELTSCEDCAQLHICVWTKDGETGKCLDERDPGSVYGTRQSCSAESSNGYKDVKSKDEDYTEEVANMVGDADMAEDQLGGDRVVVRAVDVDDGPEAKEDKEDLTNTDPKWAKNRKISQSHWTGYDGTSVHTKTIEVKHSKGGKPHEAPPASGEESTFTNEESTQVDPEETADSDEEATDEEASFRSKRVSDPDMDAIHSKYDHLQGRVAELEKQLSGSDAGSAAEEEDPEDELENSTEAASDDVAPSKEAALEYGAPAVPEPLEEADNMDNFKDPEAAGEHEPIVKEVTVTKITKNEEGEVVGQPVVTKSLEQLDDGKADANP